MIKRKISIGGLLLTCLFTAQANGNWTLQDCIDHALQHNIQIQKNRLSEKPHSKLQLNQKLHFCQAFQPACQKQ